jgi:demethylmenaquinone methyltransferase/2-methoxy-6-polyprenyl-1,4-benzoquinol methylase
VGEFAPKQMGELHPKWVGEFGPKYTPGQRLALLGLKHPEKWPDWIIEVGIWLNKPFGVNRDYESLQPWKSVQQHMNVLKFKEIYFGAAYICVGELPL